MFCCLVSSTQSCKNKVKTVPLEGVLTQTTGAGLFCFPLAFFLLKKYSLIVFFSSENPTWF